MKSKDPSTALFVMGSEHCGIQGANIVIEDTIRDDGFLL